MAEHYKGKTKRSSRVKDRIHLCLERRFPSNHCKVMRVNRRNPLNFAEVSHETKHCTNAHVAESETGAFTTTRNCENTARTHTRARGKSVGGTGTSYPRSVRIETEANVKRGVEPDCWNLDSAVPRAALLPRFLLSCLRVRERGAWPSHLSLFSFLR